MTEKPILFSAPMVRAIIEGRKTQTRRVIKPQPEKDLDPMTVIAAWDAGFIDVKCPYGRTGDHLWVREQWQTYKEFDKVRPRDISNQAPVQYPATYDGWDSKKRPSIFMPRWASRITLEITNVRVERLQDISEDDAWAEGLHGAFDGLRLPSEQFKDLWEAIHGEQSWDKNPFVWVIEFKRI